MRIVFSVLSILIVLALAGVLARKQLVIQPQVVLPGAAHGSAAAPQSRQVQQQYKQALENAMQQARPMPEDSKSE
jgi:uncharacterized membrane protein